MTSIRKGMVSALRKSSDTEQFIFPFLHYLPVDLELSPWQRIRVHATGGWKPSAGPGKWVSAAKALDAADMEDGLHLTAWTGSRGRSLEGRVGTLLVAEGESGRLPVALSLSPYPLLTPDELSGAAAQGLVYLRFAVSD